MYGRLNLPPFCEIRKVPGTSRKLGLFATKPIKRGTKLFTRQVHTAGIGGKTLNDVRTMCHHCLANLGEMSPFVCRDCRIASYCSRECMENARPLHRMECEGMIELEKLRGKVTIVYPRPSSWPDDICEYWPPAHALLAARVINKGAMKEDPETSDWMDFATIPSKLPPSKGKVFAQLEKYVRLLVPEEITEEEIAVTLRAISVNAGTVEHCPKGVMASAVYNLEYTLLDHMCKPNCEEEELNDEDGNVPVYSIEDIEAGTQLGISFLMMKYYINVREVRLPKLKECFGIDCKCYICTGETEKGSYLWLVDKQKSSLVAPWSFKTAHNAMVDGWNAMCDSIPKPPAEATAMLQSSLDTLHIYLDQRNVMLVLTAVTLFQRYYVAHANHEAINVFYSSIGKIGLFMLYQYGTRKDMAEMSGKVSTCFLEIEEIRNFDRMFKLTQHIHPRQPSTMELGRMLGLSPPPFLSEEDIAMHKKLEDCAERAARLGVPRDVIEEQILQLMEHSPGGRPDIPTTLKACQDLLDIGDSIGQGMDD